MTDEYTIKQSLEGFEFTSYTKVVDKLLSVYGIVDSTIKKITEGIGRGEKGPFYVYRRALLFCTNETDYKEIAQKHIGAAPLLIVFHPEIVYIYNSLKGEKYSTYQELKSVTDYLMPLVSWDSTRKDHYSTLELDELVESLYRALIMDENSDELSRRTIFNLLYISHFSRLMKLSQPTAVLSNQNLSEEEKVKAFFRIFTTNRCKFVVDNIDEVVFSKESLKYILAILKFDTTHIDAEILTSLIYRMAGDEEAGIYGHQTSFENVEKVLNPLFLTKMQKEAANSTAETVFKEVTDIYSTVVLDPTNSPGCFLTASYNGLLQLLRDIERTHHIRLNDHLEISHFVAILGNTLTEELTRLALSFTHIRELSRTETIDFDVINEVYDNLSIHLDDSLQCNWGEYVDPSDNLYIAGSPKFAGVNQISATQKELMQTIFNSHTLHSADLSSAWLVKAARFICGSEAQAAFVMTNSVSQGEQSTFISRKVEENGCEYRFAHRSFKWKNSNRDTTGVTVVVIGIESNHIHSPKLIFDNGEVYPCNEIGCHLIPDIDIRIEPKNGDPLSPIMPPMRKGNMPYCADALIFTTNEKEVFLNENPEAKKYIRALYGSEEFVSSTPRWCLWITDKQLPEAKKIEAIANRIEIVRAARANTTASQKCKNNPHKFREQLCTSRGKVSLFVPTVTSENRYYFQMGIIDDKTIANNNSFVVYDCDIWLLALLESRMHMLWAKNACGGHETRPRYSNTLCYNTFPAPEIDHRQKGFLHDLAKTLLEIREKYCDRSIGKMYKNMPPELLQIHELIDRKVDSLYQSKPFESDAERLLLLKKLYKDLI